MQKNRKLRRRIDPSVIMQHIFDFVCSIIIILCLILNFEHYILHSGLPYHITLPEPSNFKASDILCLLTNSGSWYTLDVSFLTSFLFLSC